jgi:hypothetical protein
MSKSMRDQLSEAMETMGDEGDETRQEIVTDEDDAQIGDPAPGTEGSEGDNEGTGDEKPAENETADKKEAAEAKDKPTSAEDESDAKAASNLTDKNQSLKAPAGWAPKERELWSKVPRELQERISAREREMSDSMANTKESKQVSDYVSKMGEHFAPMMKGSGFQHPLDAAGAAMGSMNVLHSGTQQEKAKELARIINQFGVDIEELDSALVGGSGSGQGQNQGQEDPQQAAFKKMLDERMGPINELMTNAQNIKDQQSQQSSSKAQNAVVEFSKNAEFLNDVREDMADIIELADKRGVELTLQQAYDRACAGNPDISSVIEQRKSQNNLSAKRAAAASISGRKSGGGGKGTGMTLRQQLAAAIDEANE